ncbi:MAG: ABC transporter substrate-binding protein [Candidatus Dormibacterales bacterium]
MRGKTRMASALVAAGLAAAACGGTGGQSPSAGGTPKTSSCITAPGDLVNGGSITWGSDVSYPPQESFPISAPTTPTGFDIDVAAAIAKKMCLQSQVVNQGFDGIIPALGAKKFDAIISAMTVTADRSKVVSFVPYFNAGEALVATSTSSLNITDLSQLCGRSVAVESGTAEESEIKTSVDPKCGAGKQVNLKVFPVDTAALAELRKGGVDVHFTDSPVAEYEVKQSSDLKVVSPVLETAPEGIAVRKDDPKLLQAITKAFKAIEKDGTYDQLLTKWGLTAGDIRKA